MARVLKFMLAVVLGFVVYAGSGDMLPAVAVFFLVWAIAALLSARVPGEPPSMSTYNPYSGDVLVNDTCNVNAEGYIHPLDND